jgi:protocadherin Fat 4
MRSWQAILKNQLDAKHFSGFRGCIANFTLNDELQSARAHKGQLLEADLPAGVHLNGCDVDVLRVVASKSAVDVGVTVVIVFFVLLLCTIAASFTYFKLRRRMEKKSASEALQKEMSTASASNVAGGGGHVNRSLELEAGNFQLNNQPTPKPRPDIIEAESGIGRRGVGVGAPLPRLSPDPMSFDAEHYDLENASSIAPSDIDIVYHYKGYRRGGRSLPKKKRQGGMMQNTPLARLSPSSEISHNTPRILTLGDLSGKRLPPGLLAEQSERSLNSPVSHVSSGSRHSRHHNRGGLTSENVARFNSGNGGRFSNGNTSTLVNTLDLVSVGSESRKKSLNTFDEKSNNVKDDLDLQSSSSSDSGQ